MNLDNEKELEDIEELLSCRTSKRELTDDEKNILESLEAKKKTNKMHFLVAEEMAINKEDILTENDIEAKRLQMTRVVPKDWKEEYKKIRKKGIEASKRLRPISTERTKGITRNGSEIDEINLEERNRIMGETNE